MLPQKPLQTVLKTTDEPKSVADLIISRGAKYGEAWILTGQILGLVQEKSPIAFTRLFASPYGFNWVIILNKLVRALASPTETDHWHDSQAYAKLVADHIDYIDSLATTKSARSTVPK